MRERSAERQATLDGYGNSILSSDANAVSGVVDRLKWWGGQPHLTFVQPDRARHERTSLPLPLLLGADVRVTVGTERSCTSCGRPLEEGWTGRICGNCQGDPPFAPCIQNPATNCSVQNCPYPDYKERSCDLTHLVYLAATDRVKVGITRSGRARWRWAEQGASHALPIAEAYNRKLAGIIERSIAKETGIATRTRYRWYEPLDDVPRRLAEAACAARDVIPERINDRYLWNDRDPTTIRSEVIKVPSVWLETGEHPLPRGLGTIQPGQTREGQVIAARGPFIATARFLVNTREVAGYQLTIESEAPFLDTYDSASSEIPTVGRGSDVPGDSSPAGQLSTTAPGHLLRETEPGSGETPMDSSRTADSMPSNSDTSSVENQDENEDEQQESSEEIIPAADFF